jgi:hypothetical protein
MVLVRILMSKSGFEDEVLLIKLIVGVVSEACNNNNKKTRGSSPLVFLIRSTCFYFGYITLDFIFGWSWLVKFLVMRNA